MVQEATSVKPEQQPLINRLIMGLAEHQALASAVALAEKLAAAIPDDAVVHYNLACLHARLGHSGKALVHLKTAVDLGYNRWNHLRTDPDFKNIHHTEYFKYLVGCQAP